MKRISIVLMVIAMSIVLSVSYAADTKAIKRNNDAASERRLALIIGNGAYKKITQLKNPVNDANDMKKTLENLGFDVIIRTDAGYKEMEDAVREFGEKLKKSDFGLFFYSGHGSQYKGTNFLIPADADIRQDTDLKYKAVQADMVIDEMNQAGNRINIVILDACRDNPFAGSSKSARQGLAQMNAPEDKQMLIAYATAPNSVALDGTGRNSPYTKNLLKNMTTPGLRIEDVFKKVRGGVISDTGSQQFPWIHASISDDFYFLADSGSIVKEEKTSKDEKPKEAILNVTADVSSAEVWVNGRKYGDMPREITLREAGKYEVEVTASGYKKYRTSKNIELGKEYEVAVHLEKEQVEAPPAPVVKPSVSQKPQPSVSGAKYPLRSEPITTDNPETDFKLNSNRKPLEYVQNDFTDNGDGTITDRATGLMWQKSGSKNEMRYEYASVYIGKLNREEFSGYRDWRLPTVDELKSLLTSKEQSKRLYINPIFDEDQSHCWTSDKTVDGSLCGVNFSSGSIHSFGLTAFVRAVRSLKS